MSTARLAAWLDSYRAPLKDALQAAVADGYHLLEANAARGEFDPRELGTSARRHLSRYVRNLGAELTALSIEWPGLGLADPRRADQRVDQLRRVLELCADLRVRHAGVSLSGFDHPKVAPLAQELLGVVGDLADRFGVDVVVHGGQPPSDALVQSIRAAQCPSLQIGVDTGHLVAGVEAVERYAALVGSVRLRDVRPAGAQVEEVPFGQGRVDFPALLARLEGGGYGGPFVVRRDQPGIDAMRQGREYIASLIARPVRR